MNPEYYINEEQSLSNDPTALEEAISKQTVAFLVEPIQGEAGVIITDDGYLRKVREICNKKGIILILDEI